MFSGSTQEKKEQFEQIPLNFIPKVHPGDNDKDLIQKISILRVKKETEERINILENQEKTKFVIDL